MWETLKNRMPLVVALVMVATAIVGIGAFVLALRPCVVNLGPGDVLIYRIEEVVGPLPDNPEAEAGASTAPHRQRAFDLVLVGLSENGDAALLAPGSPGGATVLHRVVITPNGLVRRRESDGRLRDEGVAIGFFDLNLFPLPPGLEQSWDAPVTYAYPPSGKRVLTADVRRMTNGYRPGFRSKLPTVEWVAPGKDGVERYVQVKNLRTDYVFDTLNGNLAEATMRLEAGLERPAPKGRHTFVVEFTMNHVAREVAPADPSAIEATVLAIDEVQLGASRGDRRRVARALERLRSAQSGCAPVDALRQALLSRFEGGNLPAVEEAWAVQVATASTANLQAAEDLRMGLIADGYPAYVVSRGSRLVVAVGPYTSRDAAVLAALRRRFPRDNPFWIGYEP